jgi:uncharacterized membrane protein YedE/YeeE
MGLAGGGLLIGLAFGALVVRTNFCTMGALSDVVNFGDRTRLRAWILAAITAIAGTQALAAAGVMAPEQSMYLTPQLNWVGSLLGGTMFGFGMVLAGGCASKNLARAGGGDLRALLTLVVVGMTAYAAIGGILGPVRAALEQSTALDLKRMGIATQSLGAIVAKPLGLETSRATQGLSALLVLAGLAYCFASARFRRAPPAVLSGFGVGLCVVAGWAFTGLAQDEFALKPTAPMSLTFVRPTGDTLEWLQRYTATPIPGFGVATVIGSLFGAFLMSLVRGRFHLTTFSNVADTRRVLGGAVLMGFGGVMALGCTIGQGVTGISTLAAGSFAAVAGIVAGGVAGLKHLERVMMAEE